MSGLVIEEAEKPDIEHPRHDQSSFSGRAKHFFTITNPLNLLCTSSQLSHAKDIVQAYRSGNVSPSLTVEELWRAKHVYDSAFHPDTNEKTVLIGRMSAQVPMNMSITGCMMTFYRTTPAVVFWQWINQSFNALVNYSNRSGEHPIPVNQLGMSYCAATGGALITALGLNSLVKSAPPLIGRFVPFFAVGAANCVNIPMMRSRELREGVTLLDSKGKKVGESKVAAKHAISMVVFSRIAMATPGMVIPPFIMNSLEKKEWMVKRPYLSAPIQVLLVGACLVFATPLCCALFPQKSSIKVSQLEEEVRKKIAELPDPPTLVYYNKGL